MTTFQYIDDAIRAVQAGTFAPADVVSLPVRFQDSILSYECERGKSPEFYAAYRALCAAVDTVAVRDRKAKIHAENNARCAAIDALPDLE